MTTKRQLETRTNAFFEVCRRCVLFLLGVTMILGCAPFARWDEGLSPPTSDHQKVDIQFGIARRTERNGELLEAKKMYLRILNEDPNHAAVLHRLGVVSTKLEEIDRALQFFERAMEIAEPTAELLSDYGYTQFLKGNLPEASRILSKSLKMNPNDRRIVNNLALVMGYQGQFVECLSLFRRVNTESEALSNLAFVHSQIGNYAEASKYYHQALDLNPELKEAGEGLIGVHQFRTTTASNHDTSAIEKSAAELVERAHDNLLGLPSLQAVDQE